MANTAKNPTKVITGPKTIFSYLNVNEPKVPMGGGTPKYSVSLIIPKSDTVTVNKIKAAIKAAYDEGQSKLKGNSKFVPDLDALKTPLRDGDKDRKGDAAYANSYFVNANSTTKPGRRSTGHHRYLRALLRYRRQSIHQLLRLQLQRQQRYRLRSQQSAETC